MTTISSSLNKTEDGTPAINRALLSMVAGVRKHLTRAEFDAAVAAERQRIANNSIGIYQTNEEFSVIGELGVRYWVAATGGSDAANAAASNARTVLLATGKLLSLQNDANTVTATTGAPANGTGNVGDLAVDQAALVYYLKGAGGWGSAQNLLPLNTAQAAAMVIPATNETELQVAISVLNVLSTGGYIGLPHGGSIALTQTVSINTAKMGLLGNGCALDASGLTTAPALLTDYVRPGAAGWQKYSQKIHGINDLRIGGPGKGVANSVGWFNNGSQTALGPRPSMSGVMIHDFETGEKHGNNAYICATYDCDVYNCKYAWWQLPGSDSGENITRFGGGIYSCDLAFRGEDNSTEIFLYGKSVDYCKQLLVGVGSPTRFTAIGCHIEPRGANLASDAGNYVLDGSGSDTRAVIQALDTTVNGAKFALQPVSTQTGAMTLNVGGSGAIAIKTAAFADPGAGDWVSGQPVELVRNTANNCYVIQATRSMTDMPCVGNVSAGAAVTCDAIITRDSFIDLDGNGSRFLMEAGWFDVNNSGGVGPYAWQQMVMLRHKNAKAVFHNNAMQNLANTANKFWSGIGRCIVTGTHTQNAPSMPSRISDQPAGNLLIDGPIANGLLQDLWFICKDGAAITNRFTGTNGSFARSTTFQDAGANGSLKITKTGAAGTPFQVGVLVPVSVGRRISAFLRAYRPAPTTGIFIELRWARRTGSDANGIPLCGQPSTASPFTNGAARSGTFSTATVTTTASTWTDTPLAMYLNGSSGDESAPEWASDAFLIVNMDAAGPEDLYIDNVYISGW